MLGGNRPAVIFAEHMARAGRDERWTTSIASIHARHCRGDHGEETESTIFRHLQSNTTDGSGVIAKVRAIHTQADQRPCINGVMRYC